MKSINLSIAMAKETCRKATYMDTGVPYQPRIYHITGGNVEYPKKDIKDPLFKYGRLYDTNHWMIGNIIRNPFQKYENEKRQKRNYAIWYSIDGRTSHSMTRESFDSIAPMLEQLEIKPLAEKKFRFGFEDSYKLKGAETEELIAMAKSCLSHLCRRSHDPMFEISEHEATIRYFLERSIVTLIRSPNGIADLMEHVMKEHDKVLDCGYHLAYSQDGPTMRAFRIKTEDEKI